MTRFGIEIVVSSIGGGGSTNRDAHLGLGHDKFSQELQVPSHPTVAEIDRWWRSLPHLFFFHRVVGQRVCSRAAGKNKDSLNVCRPRGLESCTVRTRFAEIADIGLVTVTPAAATAPAA